MTAVATVACACGCGQPTKVRRGKPNRFVFRHNARLTGERHRNWRGGEPVQIQGYWYASIGNGKRRRAHVLIAEKAMGRPLPPKAQVHHVNEDRGDNANGNLVVCQDAAYHQLLHLRKRALDATGDPSMLRCRFCGAYDRPENLTILAGKSRAAGLAQHRPCHTMREAERRQMRIAS